MFRAAVVRGSVACAIRFLFRSTVFRRKRCRLLFGDFTETYRTRSERVPLHHGFGRDQAVRVRAGVRTDQVVWTSVAGHRFGGGRVLVATLSSRVGRRWRRRHTVRLRRSRPRDPCPGDRQPDAHTVDRVVHGICQHRSGPVTMDHGGRGENRFTLGLRDVCVTARK